MADLDRNVHLRSVNSQTVESGCFCGVKPRLLRQTELTHLWLLRLAMSRTVWAVSEAKSNAPATGLVTVPTRPLPSPEKKPLTPPSVFTPSTVEVMMLVIPPMIPGEKRIE